MIKVTSTDIDAACAAYARATGDTPRREGIRVALHSFNQLTAGERDTLNELIFDLEQEGDFNADCMANVVRRLAGIDHE